MTNRILIVIPCFNEAENIPGLLAEIESVVLDHCDIVPLFVNDASTDGSGEVLVNLRTLHLENAVNLGIGGTVQVGLRYALENGFDFAVQIDGDGQHPPPELAKLIGPVLSGSADVAIGSRFIVRKGFRSTYARRAGITVFRWLNRWLAGIDIRDSTSGFRAYNRRALEHLVAYYPDEYPEPEAVLYLASKSMRIKEVAVSMRPRMAGSSSIRWFHTMYYMGKVVLNILFLRLRLKK